MSDPTEYFPPSRPPEPRTRDPIVEHINTELGVVVGSEENVALAARSLTILKMFSRQMLELLPPGPYMADVTIKLAELGALLVAASLIREIPPPREKEIRTDGVPVSPSTP